MLEIIHQDKGLLVVNKPSGVSVTRDRLGGLDIWNEIKKRFPTAKPVHRLDKGTSGVLVVALERRTQVEISRMLSARLVGKHYVGLACGHVPCGKTLAVNLPLKPGRKHRIRVAGLREEIRSTKRGWHIACDDGHRSVTLIRCLEWLGGRSLLAIKPLTGRTHQIRVHLSWIGHAIVGDHLYGAPNSPEQVCTRMMLHCHRMVLPGLGSFEANLPQVFC